MGVLACDRNGCENIMCDNYSSAHGYLCNSCMSELRAKVPDITISEFMASPAQSESQGSYYQVLRDAALAYVDDVFGLDQPE